MQACPAVKLHKDPLSPFHLVEVNLSPPTHTGEEEEKGRRVGVIPSFSWSPRSAPATPTTQCPTEKRGGDKERKRHK